MDAMKIEAAIKQILTEIRARLDEAASIAQAAVVCAEAGNVGKGIEISMDIEQLVYEASRLQDAVSLLHRVSQD